MSDVPNLFTLKSSGGNGVPEAAAQPESSPAKDFFDNLDALRLDPAASLSGTVEHLGHVPVRKPGKVEFFRAHPAEDMSLTCTLFHDDEERESYMVAPQARPQLLGHLKPVLLMACISRQGVVFLWPVPLPNEEGGGGSRAWGDTQRQAANLAQRSWIRIRADMALGAYRIHEAEGVLPDPVWPSRSLNELLEIAFRGRVIADLDHPVIRKLRGLS
jgi:hypothetical protein